MNLAILLVAASQAAYNSGTVLDITPEYVEQFKKSVVCKSAPDDAMSVHEYFDGIEATVFIVHTDGQIDVLKDGIARRISLDYCSQ
jgi:hypothetical protein